ncbi:MAG: DUF7248 family protein [Desulfobulbia bacterium]
MKKTTTIEKIIIVNILIMLSVIGLLLFGGYKFVGTVQEKGLKGALESVWEGPKDELEAD